MIIENYSPGPIIGNSHDDYHEHITIVLATYNRSHLLRKALASLMRQETSGQFSFDIMVVDDGSTDLTASVVRNISETASGILITYTYQENMGHCIARNTGAALARGNWLAFFDDDQWAESRWLIELYRTAKEHEADLVGGTVVLDLPKSASPELGARTRRLLSERLPEQRVPTSAIKDRIGSGNVLIRRAVFRQMGGFDTIFRRGYDTDLFWRVEREGFRLGYAPQAIVHHVISESRFQPSYLRRLCLVRGLASARIYWQYQGMLALAGYNLWRLGVAVGRDLPLLAIVGLAHHRPLLLDSLCSLWYTLGIIRGSLFLMAPRIFSQKKFLATRAFLFPADAG
jgi:GT2 family glycosyltransferase